jgi:hypothetical protein
MVIEDWGDGDIRPNWAKWEMRYSRHAPNIQGSFGITTPVSDPNGMGDFYLSDVWTWVAGASSPATHVYDWGNQLVSGFWMYTWNSLPSPAQQIVSPQKINIQFENWLWSNMELLYEDVGNYWHIEYANL